MDLQRLGAKLHATRGTDVPLHEFVPLFHRWIQNRTAPGTPIDVADYRHVHQGPGVVLVGFEAHLAVDEERGERGLAIDWKRPLSGSPVERLRTVLGALARAARSIETDPAFAGRIRFGCERLTLRVGDRALTPNDDSSWTELVTHLTPLASRIYGDSSFRIERDADPLRRLGCDIHATQPLDVAALLERLEDSR